MFFKKEMEGTDFMESSVVVTTNVVENRDGLG